MPKIAISYRRADSEAMTGRIFDRLIAHYGKEAIFRDIDDIPPGIDFRALQVARRNIEAGLAAGSLDLAIDVLLPLSELAPHITHPQHGSTISEILGGLKDPKKVVLLRP